MSHVCIRRTKEVCLDTLGLFAYWTACIDARQRRKSPNPSSSGKPPTINDSSDMFISIKGGDDYHPSNVAR
jgi:hypothetical protein